MRRGTLYRRCTACGRKVEARRCPGCGGTSSTWCYQLDVAPPGAPRRRRTKGGFATKAEAVAAMAELQGEELRGTTVEPSKLLLGDYLESWLKAQRAQVAPSTWLSFRLHVRSYLAPLAAIPLQSLTATVIDELYAELLEEGAEGGNGPLSPKSVTNCHGTLHKALEDAVRKRLIAANPAAAADRPTVRPAELDVWDADQLRQFLAGVAKGRLFPLWRILAHTGMRRGEALALRWKAVDLDTETVTINRALSRGPDGFVPKEPKTSRGRRTIDIDPTTVGVLRDWRRRQLEDRMRFGPGWADGDLVFTREDGTAHNPDTISPAFARAVEASGLPRVTLQGLRHTHATILLARGVATHVVSRRLGHASEAFTSRVYAHVLPQQGAEAAAIFAEAVDGIS